MADVRWQPPPEPAMGVAARVDPATGMVIEEPEDTRAAREAARLARLRQAAAEQEATGSWLTEPEPEAPTSEREELRRQVVARKQDELARVQEAIARREGGGAGGPAVALGAMYGGHAQRMGDVSQRLAAARRGMTYQVQDPLYGPTKEYTGASREALGAEYQATQEMAAAKVLQQQRLADELEYQQREAATELAVSKAKERVRLEAQEEAVEAQRAIRDKVTAATDELASAPDVDPGRFWASRTAGQKFAAVLSSGLLGFAGKSEVAFNHIQRAISEDIEAQKSNIAKRRQVVSGRMEELGAEQSVYASLLGTLQDERAADLAFETARLEQGQREIQALMQRSGIQVLTAEQQAFIGQFQQKIADNNMRLAAMAAAHPSQYVTRRAVDRGLVKELEAEQARLGKEREMVLGGVVKGLGEEGQRGMSEADVRERRMALEERKFQFDQRQYLANKLEAISATRDLVDSFLVDYAEGIPGVGPGGLGLTTESHQAGKRLEFIREALGRMQSQGAINSEELKTFERLTTGKTDARTLTNLRELRRLITARESAVERPLEEEASAGYRRQTQGRQFDPLLEDPGGAGGGGFQTARPVE